MFNEAEQVDPASELDSDTIPLTPPETGMPAVMPPAQQRRGRKPLSADLPRQRIEYDLAEHHRPKKLAIQ